LQRNADELPGRPGRSTVSEANVVRTPSRGV
jgi:hypothetical protein